MASFDRDMGCVGAMGEVMPPIHLERRTLSTFACQRGCGPLHSVFRFVPDDSTQSRDLCFDYPKTVMAGQRDAIVAG
jgi:hypothetical protein